MCIGCVLMCVSIYSTNPMYVKCRAVAGEYSGEQLEVVSEAAFPGKVIGHSQCSRLKCAAAAAESLPSCPTLCNPIDGSPPGSPVPGILQARTLEWAAISFFQCVRVKSLSHA